jgi:hypothetical protein
MGLITSVDFCFAKKKLQKKNRKKTKKFHHHSTKKEASVLACLLAHLELCRFGFEEELKFLGHESRRELMIGAFPFLFFGLVWLWVNLTTTVCLAD